MIVILFGAPGCGKGTQAQFLVRDKGFTHLSTGDLLRKEIANATEQGKLIEHELSSGRLLEDSLVFEILKKNLDLSQSKRILFDGFPRTESQAILLDDLLLKSNSAVQFVFNFEVDEKSLLNRISGRFSCAHCNAIYNENYRTTKIKGVCDYCGSKEFKRRGDDKSEVLSKRLFEFEKLTKPVVEHYTKSEKLYNIDASLSVDVIKEKIFSFI